MKSVARTALSILLVGAAMTSVIAMQGCGSDGAEGGPVDGGPDDHCAAPDGGLAIQSNSQADCHPDAGMDMDGGDDMSDDMSDFGPTHTGTTAYDDDCKYQVSWSSTAVREDTGVTFTTQIVDLSSGKPLAGANPYIEAFLSDTHPGDTGQATTKEDPAGTYTIGPVQFDASGIWTVRFHIFGDCSDAAEDSPHGHAAFYVQVP